MIPGSKKLYEHEFAKFDQKERCLPESIFGTKMSARAGAVPGK